MSAFDLAAAFLVLIAAAGWLNARFLHRPPAVVMVLGGLVGAGLLLVAKTALPAPNAASAFVHAIETLDFPRTVIGYMLAFLLFAGAMQVSFPNSASGWSRLQAWRPWASRPRRLWWGSGSGGRRISWGCR
jgi:hypothetical protein